MFAADTNDYENTHIWRMVVEPLDDLIHGCITLPLKHKRSIDEYKLFTTLYETINDRILVPDALKM